MKRTSLILLLCFISYTSFAQEPKTQSVIIISDSSTQTQDSIETFHTDSLDLSAMFEGDSLPESLDADVDSLLTSWQARYFSQKYDYCQDGTEDIEVPDSIYMERLMALPDIIQPHYNKTVRNCINLYIKRRRDLVRYMLSMSDYYFPIIESILDKHHLPLELKYLAVIESALNPNALSPVGASGLWQFMLPTGKIYGLTINSLIDERRDPILSTEAACLYLKDMYDLYGNWDLAIASYNCGPGNVNKAIRRAGGETSFWKIYKYLPRQTRLYVPLFIAADYVMNYHCEHNICAREANIPTVTDTVIVNKMLHFEQVAAVLQMDIEEIQALNPQYIRDIVPGNMGPARLCLPVKDAYHLAAIKDTVAHYKINKILAGCTPLNQLSNDETHSRKQRIYYTVKRGENLYTVANQYGITARDIRRWNGLRSNRVYRGKRLRLYIDNGGIQIPQTTSSTLAQTPTKPVNLKGAKSYQVRSGDSLYTIALQFPGISAKEIQRANNLSTSRIDPGQVLMIPKG